MSHKQGDSQGVGADAFVRPLGGLARQSLPTAVLLAAAAVLVAACTSAPQPRAAAPEQPAAETFDERAVADFYRGKTIRIIVGFAPAGAFDFYSRLLSKYMPQHVPGNPTIIVENRPGAGSLLAANLVYNTEPKDGTVIGSFNEFLVLQQLLGTEGIQYDAARFNWLGSSVNTTSTCLVRTDLGIGSVQDLTRRELVVGTTGPGAATHDTPAVLNAALGTRFRLVSGYEGISTINLALESREIEGYCVSFDAVQITARRLLEADPPAARVLVVMGPQTPDHPYLRGVPAAETLAANDRARGLLRSAHAPSQISKPFAVAPEVPRDRVTALRKALEATYADAGFQEEARGANQELSPSNGETVTRVVRELLATPPPIVAELKEILK